MPEKNDKKTGASKEKAQSKNLTKILAIAALVLLFIGGLSVLAYNNKDYLVAGRVNGEFITRRELNEYLLSNYGQNALDQLVTEKLIFQELENNNIEITKEDIQEKRGEIASQLEAQQGIGLDEYLETQGISEEEFIDNIKTQIGVEKLFVDEVDITEDEINQFLEDYGEQLGVESEEEKRERAIDILVNQEISTLFQTWVQEIRSEAEIKNYLE